MILAVICLLAGMLHFHWLVIQKHIFIQNKKAATGCLNNAESYYRRPISTSATMIFIIIIIYSVWKRFCRRFSPYMAGSLGSLAQMRHSTQVVKVQIANVRPCSSVTTIMARGQTLRPSELIFVSSWRWREAINYLTCSLRMNEPI